MVIRQLLKAVPLALLFGFATRTPVEAASVGTPGDFGAGLILGAPTGLTAKYWLTPNTAIDGAIAWHFGDKDRLQLHADHLWHIFPRELRVPNGVLPVYIGGGLRVIAGDDAEAALRVPLGLSYLLDRVPVEIFLELVPMLTVAPNTEGDLDGAIGVRYYFK
jgi:hypothetical protein